MFLLPIETQRRCYSMYDPVWLKGLWFLITYWLIVLCSGLPCCHIYYPPVPISSCHVSTCTGGWGSQKKHKPKYLISLLLISEMWIGIVWYWNHKLKWRCGSVCDFELCIFLFSYHIASNHWLCIWYLSPLLHPHPILLFSKCICILMLAAEKLFLLIYIF